MWQSAQLTPRWPWMPCRAISYPGCWAFRIFVPDSGVELNLVEPFLCSLASHAVVLREYQIVGLAWVFRIVGLDEVVLRVALGANERTHLLMAGFAHILPYLCPGLVEGRAGRTQIHRSSIVAVGAANGVYLFRTKLTPFLCIEVCWVEDRLRVAKLAQHTWHVGTLASPAGGGLHVAIAINAGIPGAQDLAHVLKCMLVAAWGVVVA